jgi:hypothetical protein
VALKTDLFYQQLKKIEDFQKFTFQLHVLSGLRKLHPIFNKKIKTMPILFDIDFKDDQLYLEGREEGREQGVKETILFMIENLLMQNENSIKSIAKISDQTEAFVLSIKRRLIQEGKLSPRS